MNHTIIVGTDLNGRKITCSIPDTTEITEQKIIAKVTDDKYIAENKMTVEGQTGECSVGYYHYNDTINIFYLRNSSGIVTNLTNFTLPDDFGTVTEIDDTAVLYNYLTRDCHEKVYVICEDFCKEESMNKSQILTAIEDEAAEQAKSYGVPNGSIFNFDGDTIPGGFEEVDNSLVFENTDAVLTNVVSRNIYRPELNSNWVKSNCSVSLNNDEYTFVSTGADMYLGNVTTKDSKYDETRGKLIEVQGGKQITIAPSNSTFNNIYVTAYDSNKKSLGYSKLTSSTYQIPSNAKYIVIRFGVNPSTSGTTYKTKLLVSYDDDTSYTPYLNMQEMSKKYSGVATPASGYTAETLDYTIIGNICQANIVISPTTDTTANGSSSILIASGFPNPTKNSQFVAIAYDGSSKFTPLRLRININGDLYIWYSPVSLKSNQPIIASIAYITN